MIIDFFNTINYLKPTLVVDITPRFSISHFIFRAAIFGLDIDKIAKP